jgi:hypothetical protein
LPSRSPSPDPNTETAVPETPPPASPLPRYPRRTASIAFDDDTLFSPLRSEFDTDDYAEFTLWLKAQRNRTCRTLTPSDKLDILAVQAHLRHSHYLTSERRGKAPKIDYGKETAGILLRKKKICQETWRDYIELRKAPTMSLEPSARGEKKTTIPRSPEIIQATREFLYQRGLKRQLTVAKDVLDHLIRLEMLSPALTSTEKARQASARSMQRWLKRQGFKRGVRQGQITIVQRQELLAARDTYTQQMLDYKGTRRFVFLDESYIHRHYKSHGNTIYDPTDERPLPKDQHKGKRYCFIAAILSEDPLAIDKDSPASKAQLMKETIDIFSPDSKGTKRKKETKDYHGMFDSSYFANWMSKLLAALEARGITNSIIVMDNAKYHKSLPPDTPKSSWKVSDLKQAATSWGIELGPHDTKNQVWDKLKPAIARINPVVVELARQAGLILIGTCSSLSFFSIVVVLSPLILENKNCLFFTFYRTYLAIHSTAILRPTAHRTGLGDNQGKGWTPIRYRHNVC